MNASFRFMPLPRREFEFLFEKSEQELAGMGIRRIVVDEKPGYPCRVSLEDAEVGETVLAIPFTHHDVSTPYRASGPIFVRTGARTATCVAGEVPAMMRHRLLSIRAYDATGMMVDARVVKGTEIEACIGALFSAQSVDYLHVHNAGPGCYNCRVDRV